MMRWLIDTATLMLGRLRRSRRVSTTHDPVDGRVKVNLGCGLAVAPGWIASSGMDTYPEAMKPLIRNNA